MSPRTRTAGPLDWTARAQCVAVVQHRGAVLIRAPSGPYEAPSWPTPTPGVVIARTSTGHFTVTHERSGLLIAASASPENAIRLAVECSGEVDWTRHGAELRADPAALDAARAMRTASDLGAVGLAIVALADLGDLNPPC